MSREQDLEKMKAYITTDEYNRPIINIDNVIICSKNFSGIEKRDPKNPKKIVNTEGNRNFSIMITPEIADLISNFRLDAHPDKAYKVQVKMPDPEAEDQTPKIFLSIKVKYNYKIDPKTGEKKPWRTNPDIKQYSSKGKSTKDESNVDSVDDVYIERAQLGFSPYPYEVNGNVGLSPYLSYLFYKIKENDIEAKWDQDYITDSPEDFIEEMPF